MSQNTQPQYPDSSPEESTASSPPPGPCEQHVHANSNISIRAPTGQVRVHNRPCPGSCLVCEAPCPTCPRKWLPDPVSGTILISICDIFIFADENEECAEDKLQELTERLRQEDIKRRQAMRQEEIDRRRAREMEISGVKELEEAKELRRIISYAQEQVWRLEEEQNEQRTARGIAEREIDSLGERIRRLRKDLGMR